MIESLGSTDNMSSVNEKTPEQDATGGAVTSARVADSRGTDGRDGRGRCDTWEFQDYR